MRMYSRMILSLSVLAAFLAACGQEKAQSSLTAANGSQDQAASACSRYDFANFPGAWPLAREGRMQAGVANESVVDDPWGKQGRVLQVSYPRGTASPAYSQSQGLKAGGTQFLAGGPKAGQGMKLSYWYRFPDDFDCVKGGKLPGIASTGKLISGGETPDGRNGFSVRLMWREECKGEVYAYIPQKGNEHLQRSFDAHLDINQKSQKVYGWSLGRGSFRFPKGSWALVEMEVRANSVGRNDAMIRVRINKKTVFERKDLLMRTTDQLQVGRYFFSTFFGGSSTPYATSKDEVAYFADAELCTL